MTGEMMHEWEQGVLASLRIFFSILLYPKTAHKKKVFKKGVSFVIIYVNFLAKR